MLDRLEPIFFDPDVDPILTNKSPGPGQDLLLASANNLYDGVSMADLEGFDEEYALNSRLVKRDGALHEEVYRIDGNGRYADDLREVVRHLEAAIPYATGPMAEALEALIAWYRTGHPRDRRAYDIAWVADQESPVDTINGFTEVYMDARGAKGAWEALVYYVNPEKTEAIRTLAEHAQWFEDRMPWNPRYRKAGVRGITANAIDVVIEIGDAGPVTPIGINLPNDQTVREQYGSKSISLSNVIEAYDLSRPPAYRSEFTWDEAEDARAERWGSLAGRHDDEHARGDRPRLGAARRASGRQRAAVPQGAVLGARGGPRGPHRPSTSSPTRSWSRSASSTRPTSRTSSGPSTRPTRATPSCSSGASGRATSSSRTTCATGRWWSTGSATTPMPSRCGGATARPTTS